MFCPDHPQRIHRPHPPLCQLVGKPSCILKKKEGCSIQATSEHAAGVGKCASYGRRGRGSGRQGAKYRSTKQQLQRPANGPASRRLFISVSAFNFRVEKAVKKDAVSQSVSHRSAQFYVQPTAVSAGSPPVVRRLFEVNSEPHTGARPNFPKCPANRPAKSLSTLEKLRIVSASANVILALTSSQQNSNLSSTKIV